MFTDPTIHEQLLLLVSVKHTMFNSTWLPIFKAQDGSRAPIMFEKTMCFQIEAEVVKNSKRDDYVNGLITEDEVHYQRTYVGGAGVCLHFPDCDCQLDIELKFASILFEVKTFHVWGTQKLGHEFCKRLVKLKNETNRDALFCRYLLELYGDAT